ncbi:MAG: glycosyltransferase family 2 protein [Microlunatus sp.]
MASVVVAAHNEGVVIASCIGALQDYPGNLDIVVVPNGCSDDTAEMARAAGARVIETEVAGKSAALNLGDAATQEFPRLYLDADISITGTQLAQLISALESDPATVVVAPARRIVTTGRPVFVRAYYAINQLHPAFKSGLFGRGVCVMSEAGRSRFIEFPDIIADDLFLDSLFTLEERKIVDEVVVSVAAPMATGDLLRRLVRVRKGNSQLREASADSTLMRAPDRTAWLREVVIPNPSLMPAAIVYVLISVLAAIGARLSKRPNWGQDRSTRKRSR